MRIFFGGAEAPTLRRRLRAAGALRFSVSYWHLRDRLPKDGTFPFAERFPEGAEILLDSGGFTANKNRDKYEDDFWIDYLDEYVSLVSQNLDALTLVTEFDFLEYSVEDLWALRFDVWGKLPPEKFLPVWHPEHGFDELVKLANAYPRVAVPGSAMEDVSHRLPALSNRHGCRFHGLAVNSQTTIERAALSSVSSTGWTSATRHGERVIFDGSKLHRYGKDAKKEALQQHRPMLERAGFDIDALMEQDPEELTKLSVWSFTEWSEFLTRKMGIPSTPDPQVQEPSTQTPEPEPTTPPVSGLNSIVARTPEARKVLPIISVDQGTQRSAESDGSHHEVHSESQISSRSDSVRQCSSCYLANVCPEYSPGNGCAYEIPVEIKSKEQLVAVMTALLEMQGQRTMFSRFAEELEGGYPSVATSKELDRFFDLTEKMKDIQDNRDFLRISVEGKANGGVLSRLFGDEAGRRNRELEQPLDAQQTNQLLAGVVEDAEIVEE